MFFKKLTWKKYGTSFDSYLKVKAYSNKENGEGGKYQCTELVHRFIRKTYGFPTRIGMGLGHGKNLARNIGRCFRKYIGKSAYMKEKNVSLKYYKNGYWKSKYAVGWLSPVTSMNKLKN